MSGPAAACALEETAEPDQPRESCLGDSLWLATSETSPTPLRSNPLAELSDRESTAPQKWSPFNRPLDLSKFGRGSVFSRKDYFTRFLFAL